MDYSERCDVDATFGGDTLQMRELVFQRGLALYEQHERSLAINPTKHRIGHVLMSEQQREGQQITQHGRRRGAVEQFFLLTFRFISLRVLCLQISSTSASRPMRF